MVTQGFSPCQLHSRACKLSLTTKKSHKTNNRKLLKPKPVGTSKMAAYRALFLLPAIFVIVFPLLETRLSAQPNNDLISELQQIKLKIAHLESVLEESIKSSNEKSLYLRQCEKRIEEMSNKIQNLQSTLSSIEIKSLHTEGRLEALEEEVQLLWAASRKNNFDLHILESKAQDADDRLELLTSQVEQMADIVTEHWIQIQRLEQALQITKIRTMKSRRQVGSARCIFLKVSRVLDSFLFGEGVTWSSRLSQCLHQLRRLFTAAKKYHHELQAVIKKEMERYEFTASLVNDELVFFLASALITFPLIWMLLSS
ncbi:Alpha-1,4 glucan phosphorylase [Quillaja saponaria]|uniref:Alpha-1,4 glucan phosphorylase n=1 Tax=Quillaja saponaria TaxID=32244 RepID=A0AAD7PV72_QUISA|nr:Alpha-1,4 glucan phosphorylase [Quillaja saponaria]